VTSGKVGRERNLLRRSSLRFVPALERLAVATDVLARSSECDQNADGFASVGELPARRRGNANDLVFADLDLTVLKPEAERPAQHEVDLFLLSVPVDPPSLSRPEREQVDAEAGDAKLATKRDESLLAVEVERRSRDHAVSPFGRSAANPCSWVAVFIMVRREAELSASTRELLAWIDERPRTHADVMNAWRSSCPRLAVWEDALADGLIRVVRDPAMPGGAKVTLTARGEAALGSH